MPPQGTEGFLLAAVRRGADSAFAPHVQAGEVPLLAAPPRVHRCRTGAGWPQLTMAGAARDAPERPETEEEVRGLRGGNGGCQGAPHGAVSRGESCPGASLLLKRGGCFLGQPHRAAALLYTVQRTSVRYLSVPNPPPSSLSRRRST